MKKFRDFLFASIYYTLPFLVLGICYLAFAFIARDLDPGRWLLWTTTGGRFISVFLIIMWVRLIFEYYNNEL